MSMDPSFSSDAEVIDRLIAGDLKLVTRQVLLADNQSVGALTRGAVLGFALGGYSIVHQTGSFPASTARAILAKDADPSGGPVVALVYELGEFNEDALSFGGTVDADDVREVLRTVGIYLKNPVSAV